MVRLDKKFRSKILPRTKRVIITTPHNPSGTIFLQKDDYASILVVKKQI